MEKTHIVVNHGEGQEAIVPIRDLYLSNDEDGINCQDKYFTYEISEDEYNRLKKELGF